MSNNVIAFRRRELDAKETAAKGSFESGELKVINFQERAKDLANDERRTKQRTVVSDFIVLHLIVPGKGLQKVALYDITTSGLSFDLDANWGAFKVGEEVAMRIYMNRETYFPFTVTVRHVTDLSEQGSFRHGVEFNASNSNNEALHHFVQFLESVTSDLRTDRGDKAISSLNS